MAMDLDKDYTINGHKFEAGKGVNVTASDTDADGKVIKNDYSQAIKDAQQAEKDAESFGGHTSGVPTEDDPTTPTSGTPTRPLPEDSNQAKENKQADKEEVNQ